MKRTLIIFWLVMTGAGCSKEKMDARGPFAKARVMYVSCGGTVLQFIGPTNAGKDWLWFKNTAGPLGATNPAQVYPNCVAAFGIPKDREIIGDTLELTYADVTNPPGIVCAIGGLPNATILVTGIK